MGVSWSAVFWISCSVAGISSYFELFNLIEFPAGCVPVSAVTSEDVAAMLDHYPTLSPSSGIHKLLKKVRSQTKHVIEALTLE